MPTNKLSGIEGVYIIRVFIISISEETKRWVFVTHHNGKLSSLQWLQVAFQAQHQQTAQEDSYCQMNTTRDSQKPAAILPGDLSTGRPSLC